MALHMVGKTDLARRTRHVLRVVQRGQTVLIEHHGQPEVGPAAAVAAREDVANAAQWPGLLPNGSEF